MILLLLPAMQKNYVVIQATRLDNQIKVSTAHSMTFLITSYPPSIGVVMSSGCGVGDVEPHG